MLTAGDSRGCNGSDDARSTSAAAAKPKPEKAGDSFKPTKLSPHGKPTLELGGQLQADTVYFSQDPESIAAVGDLQDGSQFRRLRLVARGKTWKQLQYALGVDFALANQPAFIDNYLEANDLPWIQNIRMGHYFEPFSLERVTQNRNNTFMERSLVDTFAPACNLGQSRHAPLRPDLRRYGQHPGRLVPALRLRGVARADRAALIASAGRMPERS